MKVLSVFIGLFIALLATPQPHFHVERTTRWAHGLRSTSYIYCADSAAVVPSTDPLDHYIEPIVLKPEL